MRLAWRVTSEPSSHITRLLVFSRGLHSISIASVRGDLPAAHVVVRQAKLRRGQRHDECQAVHSLAVAATIRPCRCRLEIDQRAEEGSRRQAGRISIIFGRIVYDGDKGTIHAERTNIDRLEYLGRRGCSTGRQGRPHDRRESTVPSVRIHGRRGWQPAAEELLQLGSSGGEAGWKILEPEGPGTPMRPAEAATFGPDAARLSDEDGRGYHGGPQPVLVANRRLGHVLSPHDLVRETVDLFLLVPALVGIKLKA